MAISLARIGSGLFISIHGPTLLSLADNVGEEVSTVSWLFAGRSAGVLAGGIATGFIMKRVNAVYSFGATCFLLALMVTATPWVVDLWLLVVVVLIGGITFGYLDAGMQALVLQIWGEEKSRPHIAAYHFTIAVGAFFAPLIAQPFLKEQDQQEICPEDSDNCKIVQTIANNSTVPNYGSTDAETSGVNPIVWSYLICGVVLVVVTIIFVVLGLLKVEDRVRETKDEVTEDREEEGVSKVLVLFILVCIYYFFCVAGETAYQSYIYSVSICSELCFTPTNGTWINSLYWLGFGSGRLVGIYLMTKFKPKTIIIVDLCGTIASMIIVCIFGEWVAGITWAVTFLFGFFQATIYPAGVSWTSQYTNMSGHYIFIFSAGQALGSMILLPFGGFLFQLDPFNVMYLILGCTVSNAIFFGAMIIEAKRHHTKGGKTLEENDYYTETKM
ncbi:sodium-dependent glucose transporter 1-like [Styela clava]